MKMQRLHLLAMEEERQSLMDALLQFGRLEIRQTEDLAADPDWAVLLHPEPAELVRWREGYLPAQDVPLLQAQAFEPLRGVLALHRNDPLVRCGESARKERYKSPEKGSEVTQYLLVDGVIRGAVMGHFRYGPYDLHAVWLELPEQEAAVRRDEILRAVYAVNGPREEPPPFVPVG